MTGIVNKLHRQIRLPEFRMLLLALVFISTALSSVGFFGARVEQAMQAQSGALLGADGLIASTRPIPKAYEKRAREYGLSTARTINFLSMAVTANGNRLARVKAVSPEYPLRGVVSTRPVGDDSEGQESAKLEPGTVWAASALVSDLNLSNESGQVSLGSSQFRIDREILLEPEGGITAFRIAPRIMMALADLGQTGLVTPASRARFRLLVAGPPESVAAFAEAISTELSPSESWRAADLRRDEVRSTVGRVVSYLNLAVLLSVVLAIVSMAVAAQGLWRRQVHASALVRCLGQPHAQSVRELIEVYLFSAVPIGFLGVLAGYGVQALATVVVERAAGIQFPAASWLPGATALLVSVATLMVVMVPFLLAQGRVPVMVLLRLEQRDQTEAGAIGVIVVIGLIVLITGLLASDIVLTLAILMGILGAAGIFWGFIRIGLGTIARGFPASSSPWLIGVKNLSSNARRSAWLASAFGATIFALVLLGGVRDDLFDAWNRSVPDDAPNMFLVNIQPDEVSTVTSYLQENSVSVGRFFPIYRGRLTEINDKRALQADFESDDARHRITHEFNLTEALILPDDNEIIEGRWFADGEEGFSVEEKTAHSLGLWVGSRIGFEVAGTRVVAPVVNIRSVRWDNMQPNFFVLGSPGLFGEAPHTYITALSVASGDQSVFARMSQSFPAVTLIDLGMILSRLRGLIEQAGSAVSLVFVFTLGAALLLLFGVLQSQRITRRKEIALLKTLGASRATIRSAVLIEFALLGLVAGGVGGGLAVVSGWFMATYVFDFVYAPAWRWLLVSMILGAAVVGAGGYLSIRPLFRVQPVRLLAN